MMPLRITTLTCSAVLTFFLLNAPLALAQPPAELAPTVDQSLAPPAPAAALQPQLPIRRYAITSLGETAIMLDTITGNSWVLNRVEGEERLVVWVGAPRFDDRERFRAWLEYREEAQERVEMIERVSEAIEELVEKRDQMLSLVPEGRREALATRFETQLERLRARVEQLAEEAIEAENEFWGVGEKDDPADEDEGIEVDEEAADDGDESDEADTDEAELEETEEPEDDEVDVNVDVDSGEVELDEEGEDEASEE